MHNSYHDQDQDRREADARELLGPDLAEHYRSVTPPRPDTEQIELQRLHDLAAKASSDSSRWGILVGPAERAAGEYDAMLRNEYFTQEFSEEQRTVIRRLQGALGALLRAARDERAKQQAEMRRYMDRIREIERGE